MVDSLQKISFNYLKAQPLLIKAQKGSTGLITTEVQ